MTHPSIEEAERYGVREERPELHYWTVPFDLECCARLGPLSRDEIDGVVGELKSAIQKALNAHLAGWGVGIDSATVIDREVTEDD
jgi:hypothetical protein